MKKSIIVLLAAALCLALSFSVVAYAASFATPGTKENPLIGQQNLNAALEGYATKEDVKTAIAENSNSAGGYVVLEGLAAGTIVIGDASSEMILRSGKAAAYVAEGAAGGLSDLTAGSNVTNGKAITANHLMLIPRADGRGFKVTADNTYIMVKGSYTIQ